MPAPLTRAESDDLARDLARQIATRGFGAWAVEVPGIAPFIGFVGLHRATFEASFTPCFEIMWRLARDAWGRGFAAEAARVTLRDAFTRLGLSEILAWTTHGNTRSRRVMERVGMRRAADEDFDHPLLPEGHALRRHVLYRLGSGDAGALR